ncbi:MAG: carbon-phosphorus lyase complex subunit PhnI [Brevinematales bacterium]|nr:carbon-phosphorus lyase complex subunit PhnI [Brevinematales bacterium]
MGYVAVKGGREAIDNSLNFLEFLRNDGSLASISIEQIKKELHFLVDRVMSEGSLYSPDLAAIAIKQAAGDTLEASFILRAYRSTLPRIGYSLPVITKEIRLIRRISSAFKDIPGGQFLGPSTDYSLRLINFELVNEDQNEVKKRYKDFLGNISLSQDLPDDFPKLIEILRGEGFVVSKDVVKKDKEIFDITKESLSFPAQRSATLQAMARGETGSMLLLAYSNVRGYGVSHPTIGELRVGYIKLKIKHPFKEKEITFGEILITEAELLSKITKVEGEPKFQVGYGICFGHNETKAISMAILDIAMRAENPLYPSEDQEFVLSHIDGIESMGFVNHFKLPHYVTFLSEFDRLKKSIKESVK